MLRRKPTTGFTLVELVLASALAALFGSALVSWHLHFHNSLKRHQAKQAAVQAVHHWLHWLWRDVQNTLVDNPSDWQYQAQAHCLLYGDVGVRVKSGALQWRPTDASCNTPGWQALTDPSQVRMSKLTLHQQQLCLTASLKGQPNHEACLPWPH
ncbi:hypothetical protein CWE15_06470 [Aliidiomarina taiwanensis]|uniref:Prepilin-type cleavage/methylation domain-containing protein n=1 Tax=Aliidiomarina taiwanensis TaxID=946228 RepID=A0A432X833_9GAMM|nr:hypothetical protein [Aliidiomarina taiwanensis]RUO43041.1 hypothetical protein CWE15_06470 [Aliidiomarina taiwanensis]